MTNRASVRSKRFFRAASSVRILLAVLGLASAVLPEGARASSLVQSSTFVSSNPVSSTADSDSRTGANGTLAHISSYSVLAGMIFSAAPPFPPVGTQSGSAFGVASATEGSLVAVASAGGQTSPLVQNATLPGGAATAQWSDQLTIHSPARTGQSGTVTATISIVGNLGGGVGNHGVLDFPSVDVFVRILGTGLPTVDSSQIPPELAAICGGWAYCGRAMDAPPQSSFSGSNLPPSVSISIPFTFGSPVGLGYSLDVSARASASSFGFGDGTNAAGIANYSSGLQWDGITGIFDANGNPVIDYTTSSTSGFDYGSSAVPEPHVSAALAIGVLGIHALRALRIRRAGIEPRRS